jgi:choline dehydrogenase-like flavoprotein
VKNITDDTVRAAAQRASEGPADRDGGESADRLAGALTARPGTRLLGPPTDDAGGGGLPAAAVSTNVGGMGSHWTCACPRPGAAERIPFIPGEELDEALARAEGLLGVSPDPFADAPFAGEVRERLSRALDAGRDEDRRVQGMPLAVSRRTDGSLVWSGTDVILGDAADDSRVEITDLAQCRSVVTEDGRAVGVVVRDLTTGREGRVGARAVVVAGDALRTPQILFASGIRPWALGRYLNDQPQVVHAVRLPDEMTSG